MSAPLVVINNNDNNSDMHIYIYRERERERAPYMPTEGYIGAGKYLLYTYLLSILIFNLSTFLLNIFLNSRYGSRKARGINYYIVKCDIYKLTRACTDVVYSYFYIRFIGRDVFVIIDV